MATIVEMINPLTGLPEQVDKLDHTAQEIDDAVGLAPQISNPNLLDNWYFANPVNQRGQTSYTGAGYGIDRWYLFNNITCRITPDGLTLTSSGESSVLECYLDTDLTGKTVIMSALIDGVVYSGSKTADQYDFTGTVSFPGGTIRVFYSGGKTVFRLWLSDVAGTTVQLKAVKLELGSQQTLAHQDADGNWVLNEIPNYGEQLRRCQRYDYIIGRTDDAAPVGLGTAYSETSVIAVIELPETMRANPAVSITGAINLRFSESKNISVSSVSNYGFSGDKVQLFFSGLSGLTQGQSCDIYVPQGSKIEFNANL